MIESKTLANRIARKILEEHWVTDGYRLDEFKMMEEEELVFLIAGEINAFNLEGASR